MSGQSPVGAWRLSDYTSDNNSLYFGASVDPNFAVAQRVADDFAPRPADTPAMSVVVDAGFITEALPSGLQSITEVAQQTVTISAAPSSPNNRIDLVVIDAGTGTASVIAGTPATSPTAPAITAGKKKVAQVSVPNGTTSIINSKITDLRAVWQSGIPGIKWGVASGTVDAITLATTPATTSLTDGLVIGFRTSGANTSTTPTFNLDGLGAKTIVKQGGAALVPADIHGALAECLVRYNLANTRWEILNPAGLISDATNGGLSFSGGAAKIDPSDLLTKSAPTASDSLMIMDAAASNAAKTATLPHVLGAFSAPNSNALGGNFTLLVGVLTTGPSVARGSGGTWFASGTVTILNTGGSGDNIAVLLWDGSNLIASGSVNVPAGSRVSVSLSGFVISPIGDIAIACEATLTNTCEMVFDSTPWGHDSQVTAFRIG
jgi:hypothetical protein